MIREKYFRQSIRQRIASYGMVSLHNERNSRVGNLVKLFLLKCVNLSISVWSFELRSTFGALIFVGVGVAEWVDFVLVLVFWH